MGDSKIDIWTAIKCIIETFGWCGLIWLNIISYIVEDLIRNLRYRSICELHVSGLYSEAIYAECRVKLQTFPFTGPKMLEPITPKRWFECIKLLDWEHGKQWLPSFKSKSAKPGFASFPSQKPVGYGPGCAPVYLSVYDQTKSNRYVSWLGLGIFDSGVEVHGEEYAFWDHDYQVEPWQSPASSLSSLENQYSSGHPLGPYSG